MPQDEFLHFSDTKNTRWTIARRVSYNQYLVNVILH